MSKLSKLNISIILGAIAIILASTLPAERNLVFFVIVLSGTSIGYHLSLSKASQFLNMNARTHDAFAFASLITTAVVFPPNELNVLTMFSAVVGNIVGSLIPDMDQGGNRLWDLLPVGNTMGKIFRRIFYKHRTVSHSLLGCFLIYKLLEWLIPKILNENYVNPYIVFWSIMIGYFSHLLADCMTKEGLPLLFPLKWSFGFPPIKALRITTGSWVENFLVLPAVGIYTVWFLTKFQSELSSILRLIE